MSRTVGRVLAESLIAHGIDTIWMVPGESFLGLTDALTDIPDQMRLIVCRHEGGAGFMAVADGRMREGRAGRAAGLARAGPVQCHGRAAHRASRRDAAGGAVRPGGAQGLRPPRPAGTELREAAGRRDQGRHRGERGGAGERKHRPRLPSGRKRHAGPGRRHPARGHLRRAHRCAGGEAAPARLWRRPRRGPRPAGLDAGQGRAPAGLGRRGAGQCDGRDLGGTAAARGAMDAAGLADAPAAAALRQHPSPLRRLHGHPGAHRG